MNVSFWTKVFLTAFFILQFDPSVSWAAKKITKKKIPAATAAISAKSAILSDVTRGKRLYGKNVHRRVMPASTTKVMTALLVLEDLSLDQIVTVGKNALNTSPSKIDIQAGESFTVRDLMYAILLNSANDAAIALAEAVSGSEKSFVEKMNRRAYELGAHNTKFANCHGLPSAPAIQYTTAFDMLLIFREALKYDFFRQAIAVPYKTISSQQGRQISLKNHNKLLFSNWGKDIRGKTGYTRAAGACFIGYLTQGKRTFVIGVFGCRHRWEDIRLIFNRYGAMSL